MAIWPVGLPAKALYEGNQEAFPNLVIRTEMSSGPAKMRRRFTSGVRPGHYEYYMTYNQLMTLMAFFEITCEGGALPFDLAHPVFGNTKSYRFVGQPTWAMVSKTHYRVVFDFEIMP